MSKGYSDLYEGTKGGNDNGVKFSKSSDSNAKISTDSLTPVINYDKDGNKWVNDFPAKVHEGKQGKHIPGHNNYQLGKSTLSITISEADKLIQEKGGTGKFITPNCNKERIDFNIQIGIYKNPKTGETLSTTKGIIHYSKSGAHIVPANPNSEED